MKLDNFQITLPDPEDAYLDAFCAAEGTAPSISSWNADGGLTVPRREMKQSQFTHTILCDLGSVVRVEERYQATVQALPYRAPEVILGAGWDDKIDIWSLGILVGRESGTIKLELTSTGLGDDFRRTIIRQYR
jgi:serine/threonine-protein kinase SRPK3